MGARLRFWTFLAITIVCTSTGGAITSSRKHISWPSSQYQRYHQARQNVVEKEDKSDETGKVDSLYLCAHSSPADCYLLMTSSSTVSALSPPETTGDPLPTSTVNNNRATTTTAAGILRHLEDLQPEHKSSVRLHNGSTVGSKVPLAYDPFDFQYTTKSTAGPSNIESSIMTDDSPSNVDSFVITKKILATEGDESNSHLIEHARSHEDYNDETENQSRLIAYTIRPNLPANTTTVRPLAGVPTITLAQLARQLIFPDWLWTRIAATRKTGVAAPTVATSTATAAVARPALPTVTFDNNFSRFLKLFTLVRFQNTACSGPGNQNGTCYSTRDCANLGGTATSSCANGFGTCCVFQVRCGGRTSRNGTYFVSTGVTFAANQVQTCNVQIQKTTPFVRQIRLDFQLFSLRQPVAGSCDTDRFVVSGQNTNNVIPILCGQNSGSHIYVETSQSSANGIQLSVLTTGEGARSWSIRVTQYEASSLRLAPSNCLQYYTDVMGSFRSFNYISDVAPQYLNNLNYAICIRREAGFCSVTYSNAGPDGTYQPFQIVNADAAGGLVIQPGQAGVGSRDCPYDYITINGLRLCGERLNDGTSTVMFTQDAPVTDNSNGPFIVNVRTNEIDVGGGFSLYYRQNPCMSSSG